MPTTTATPVTTPAQPLAMTPSSPKKKQRADAPYRPKIPAAPTAFSYNFPDIDTLRSIRRLQLRFEIGFCNPERDDWPPEVEVLADTPDYQDLVRWFLRRKPYFHPSVLNTYCRLLRRHMKGKTITAHVSIEPEDGWTSFEFTVYGFRRLPKGLEIYPEHDAFLVDLFNEGLPCRHLHSHVGLTTVDNRFRPDL